MARSKPTITLSPSRDIPFDRLVLSQSNVRQIKCGLSIAELAEDIARRGLLQSLNVRPMLGADGAETGMFEIPAGGRRYRALEMLVKQKRLSRTAPVPCIVQQASAEILAEEDSLAENAMREPLHPLDQFRAMLSLVDKGQQVEAIAAHFMTTPAVVRQRLKLAAVSPKLHEIYAEDGMTLDQLMAFTVSDDHERQEQVWELLGHSYNRSAGYIRHKLTENTVRAADKRVRFVTEAAYVAAGGSVVRDLFEPDDGGWLTDVALLDRLVDEKLARDAERILAEGWKWVESAIDLPWNATSGMRRILGTQTPMTPEEAARLAALEAQADELSATWSDAPEIPPEVDASIDAVEAEIGALVDRPTIFDPEDMTRAGAFVSIDADGSLRVERGLVRPDDEAADPNADGMEDTVASGSASVTALGSDVGHRETERSSLAGGDDTTNEVDEADNLKPLPDRLVSDLTAWRTLALQDAFAKDTATAFAAVLHAMVLSAFYSYSHESCLQLTLYPVHFSNSPEGLRDSAPGHAIAQRHAAWAGRLPQADTELWDALLALDADDQASLFAHCASLGLNAQAEIMPKYDNGRISRRSIERRIAHAHVIARAVELDVIAAGWRPTVEGYFRGVTKPRILADVTEARGEQFAGMIDHLKKADMAREAERLLEETNWLPEPLRTPGEEGTPSPDAANDDGAGALPPGLTKDIDGEADDTCEDHGGADAIAAE